MSHNIRRGYDPRHVFRSLSRQGIKSRTDFTLSSGRKQQVSTGQTELQALEARLKEMEARLQTSKLDGSGGSPRAQRRPLANTFSPAAQPTEKGLPQRPPQAASRPGTAKQAQLAPMHGGAMPPTPTASEGESDLVKSSSHDHDAETASFADYVIVSKDGEDRDS